MPIRKVPVPLGEETHHKPRAYTLASLRGRFSARRSSDGVRLGKRRRGPLARLCVNALALVMGVCVVGAIFAGLLAFRLRQGPISLEAFRTHIESELDQRLGEGYRFRFAQAAIAYDDKDLVKAEEWLARASRIFTNPEVLAPWQDTLVEFGYIKSFYGGELKEE